MSNLEGKIIISDLPPHRGLIASICFFGVAESSAPVPYDGDPPTQAATDCDTVYEEVDLNTESSEPSVEVPFAVERAPGYWYIQLRAILFRKNVDGKMWAQSEQFFFGRRPLHIDSEYVSGLVLPVTWPSIKIEDLHHYGTLHPTRKSD